jgi:hypothetical protein
VEGGNQREASVAIGGAVRHTAVVTFQVTCQEGNATVRVTMSATGSEIPASFTLYVYEASCPYPYYCDFDTYPIATNGVTSVVLPSDAYRLELGVGSTCMWKPEFFTTVVLPIGAMTDLEFTTSCEPPLIRVTAPTTGTNPDTEYVVALWRFDYYYGAYRTELGTLAAGGTLETSINPDYVWLELEGVAANCTVGVTNPTAASYLTWGGILEVSFPVTCGP